MFVNSDKLMGLQFTSILVHPVANSLMMIDYDDLVFIKIFMSMMPSCVKFICVFTNMYVDQMCLVCLFDKLKLNKVIFFESITFPLSSNLFPLGTSLSRITLFQIYKQKHHHGHGIKVEFFLTIDLNRNNHNLY